jgi:sugar lactone lactonase YvrE
MLASVSLISCGGGTSQSITPSATVSTLSFPLHDAIVNSVVINAATNYTVSGTCNGTASVSGDEPIPNTFEGISGTSETSTQILTVNDCSSSTTSYTEFFDKNFSPVGEIDSDGTYGVYRTTPDIPQAVHVGDSGLLGTIDYYSDFTKTVFVGYDTISYQIEPETATSAIVNVQREQHDTQGVLTSTQQSRSKIDTNGSLTALSVTIQYTNPSTDRIVLTALPDTAPPVVVSTNQAYAIGATTPGAVITAKFSEAIDATSVDASTLTITAPDGTTAAGAVSLDGRTITFTPLVHLSSGVDYTGTIVSGVKDLAGNGLTSNFTWTFTPATHVVASIAGSVGTVRTAAAQTLTPSFGGGIAIDVDGNLYLADAYNNLILQVTPTGVTSIVAGTGYPGNTDGVGTVASFNSPSSVAVDGSGNLYVADSGNNQIRKISSSGIVSTLAGYFYNPAGIAIDSSENVYVASNNQIRKISASGVDSVLAGSGLYGSDDGLGTAARFDNPIGIAVDELGNVYVADSANEKIRKVTPAGMVSTIAGTGQSGNANGDVSNATFAYPTGVAVDGGGNIYVADSAYPQVRMITPSGVVSTIAGSGMYGDINGAGAIASFSINRIVVDTAGIVFFTDPFNNKVRMVVSVP